MARSKGVSLPSSQGGLIGGVSSSYKTRVEFSPKFVLVFSLVVVLIVFFLFKMKVGQFN